MKKKAPKSPKGDFLRVKCYGYIIYLLFLTVLLLSCQNVAVTSSDSGSDSENEVPDPALYPDNLYLGSIIASEWYPGTTGNMRKNKENVVDENGVPIMNDYALDGPEGLGSFSSGGDYTCLGNGGSAVWKWAEGRYVINGDGDDFVTFSTNFAWSRKVNSLVCELAHVEVSENGTDWYYCSIEAYDADPDINAASMGFNYFNVSNMHGANITIANTGETRPAEGISGTGNDAYWVEQDETVSPYFEADDDNLGGTRFDLSDFVSKADDNPWPADGKMFYMKLIDDPNVLDGQEYNKAWSLGANLMAAMGINTAED